MIFNDYLKGVNEQFNEIIKLKDVTTKLEVILEKDSVWKEIIFKYIVGNKVDDPYNVIEHSNNVRSIVKKTKEYCTELREDLIKIDFFDFGEIISNFKQKSVGILSEESDKLANEFKLVYKIIHEYRAYSDINKRIDGYKECINAIRKMVNIYNEYIYMCSYLNIINNELVNSSYKDGQEFTIRLLNENKDLNILIDNLNIINSIYKNTEKIISDEKTVLEYKRIESGSLLAVLAGAAVVFKTMKPMLEFGYKVYSEQFSNNAKLEAEEKKIKIRGDYLKLLKEAAELNGKEISDSPQLQEALALIEDDIKKLYSQNPYITLNGVDLGLKELKNNNIPLERLESGNEK